MNGEIQDEGGTWTSPIGYVHLRQTGGDGVPLGDTYLVARYWLIDMPSGSFASPHRAIHRGRFVVRFWILACRPCERNSTYVALIFSTGFSPDLAS